MNTPSPSLPQTNTNPIHTLARDHRLGYALLGLAGLIALGALSESVAAFFWIGAMALPFLWAHRTTGKHGFAVPGSLLMGIAVGALLEGITPFEGIFLLGFAGGFWLLHTLEPKVHGWSLYPAWIFTALAGLVFVTANAWVIAGALVIGGFYLIRRQERSVNPSSSVMTVPAFVPSTLERLQTWRTETAQRSGTVEAEVLRTEQLERLSTMTPESVDAMFGVLDAAQIEQHGKQLLEILRG
jgi:HRDC domain